MHLPDFNICPKSYSNQDGIMGTKLEIYISETESGPEIDPNMGIQLVLSKITKVIH